LKKNSEIPVSLLCDQVSTGSTVVFTDGGSLGQWQSKLGTNLKSTGNPKHLVVV